MSPRLPLILAICSISFQTIAVGGTGDDRSDDAIQRALRMREYAQAIRLIDNAMGAATPDEREFLMYRRGLALNYLDNHKEAIDQFAAQLAAFPEGQWAVKARMRMADAHVARREYDAAERIYADRVRELVGPQRKKALAQTYIEFADEYFEPTDSLSGPDFQKAAQFYGLALGLEPGEPLTETLTYKVPLAYLKAEDWNQAATGFDAYLQQYDADYRTQLLKVDATAAMPSIRSEVGKFAYDARLGRGRALIESEDQTTARRILTDLIALIEKNGEQVSRRDAWTEGMSLLAAAHGIPEPLNDHELNVGVKVLETLIDGAPESTRSVQAAYDIAESYDSVGRSDDAIVAYRALIDRTRIRPADSEAMELAAELSQDALFSIGRLLAAQTKYADAIGVWSEYVAKYPSGEHWSEAQQSIVDAEYAIGALARKEERFDDARTAWSAFLQKYPLDNRVRRILYDFGRMSFDEQSKREKANEAPNWQLPIAEWRKLVNKFPKSDEAGQAQYRIGQTFEKKVNDLEAAIKAYKALDWSSFAAKAQIRLAEMKSVQLAVETPRVFRTPEPAKIRVDTRNIDKLTIKLYRIDMEDYFRKRHTLRDVDALDLLLIDPDRQFAYDVKDFARYRPHTQEIEVPIEGPGVFAVYVSNETSDLNLDDAMPAKKLEATTLVMRSDIDILVRSTREQMLVFAQNMLTGEPASGVRLLISNGNKTILEGTTGDDGAWLSNDKEIKETSSATVLAMADGHVAGSGLSLRGLSFSGGLKPRGYITTDRSAYQPGDGVNIRGVLRETKNGQYALPTQPEDRRQRWKVDIIDAKGRVLQTDEIAVTAFGAFATSFKIAEDGPVGDYKIVARRPDGPTFATTFLVQTYQLPKAVLSFDIPEHVIMRGQPIKGAIVAKYNYGEPVRNRKIEYAMITCGGDGVHRVGMTDEKGRIEFEFDSRSMQAEGCAEFHAVQAELGLNASDLVMIATQAYKAEVELARPLFLADEPVEVTITTKDLKEKPVSQAMTVTAYRRTRSAGEWAETRVESAEITTTAESGTGRATLRLTKGGDYTIRAEGVDSLGNVVSASTTLTVSDDDDKTRLRIFSDRQHYKVGETLALDLHSRIEPCSESPHPDKPPLALLTFEGDGILSYRTIRLDKGHNVIDLPIEHAHFPNFRVAAGVMDTRNFYDASRDFTVERQLNVTLTPNRTTYRPRDDMSVDIAVTDHQGKPVSAELELTMVDNALFARYPDTTPNIVGFFQDGAKRVTSSRVESSCTFHYNARTRDMVTEILDEDQRLADAETRAGLLERLSMRGVTAAAAPAPMASAEFNADGVADEKYEYEAGDAARKPRMRAGTEVVRQSKQRLVDRNAGGLSKKDKAMSRGGLGGGRFVGGRLFEDGDGDDDWSGPNAPAEPALSPTDALKRIEAKVVFHNKMNFALEKAPSQQVVDALLASIVSTAPPRTYFPEVAYWNPRIMTDADGKASVSIVVPDSSTTWRLMARGVTTDTLCGQASVDVTSRHDFFVEILAPDALVEGDTFQPVVQVHCLSDYHGDVDVNLTWAFPNESDKQATSKIVTLNGAGVATVEFPRIDVRATLLRLVSVAKTTATPDGASEPLRDSATLEIPVEPWGMQIESHAAGTTHDSQVIELTLDNAAGDLHDRQLSIAIGADIQQWLVDEALWTGPRWHGIEQAYQSWRIAPPRTHADAASSLLSALYTAAYVKGRLTPGESATEALQLDERANSLIAQLLAAQNDDGGWAWCGKSSSSDLWTSSYVAWALGKAQRDGFAVSEEARRNLTTLLQKSFADAQPAQTELKATILHGLAWIDHADFSHANRLFRNRQSLSTAGLGYLALTFLQIDRKSMAIEVLEALQLKSREENLGGGGCRIILADANSEWMQSELEVTALALLAQLQADPSAASVPQMVAYLTGAARSEGWRPHKARGAVIAALATYYARGERERSDYRLVVSLNGKKLREIESQRDGTTYIIAPIDSIRDGQQRIQLDYDGSGEFTYAITLSGFTSMFPNPREIRHPAGWAKNRSVRPEPPEYEGRPIQPGWTVAREWGRNGHFYNEASHVPVGETVDVVVSLSRNDKLRNDAGDSDYILVQERIPSGFRLLRETLSGNHLAYDLRDNMLTLYFGSMRNLGTLTYTLVATTPGDYRMTPTQLRSVYHPERFHVNASDRKITILPRDEENPDSYRMSPDELYHMGRLLFDDGRFDQAASYLSRLGNEDWVIHDKYYEEVVRMLLTCALKRDDDSAIVDNFEILKERFPEVIVPFDEIVRVGDAYAKTGQHERAYLVYRATADGSFSRDARIGGVLKEQGRFLDSIDFLEALWRSYPDTPQVANVYFALSQSLYAQANNPADVRPRRGETGSVSRTSLILEAIEVLENYLALYPESPVADEASYSLANAWLDLDEDHRVIALTEDLVRVFPDSKWVDRFRYMQALAWFRQGDFDKALSLALQVAQSTWKDEQGIERPSPNKWLALYIAGQIYHAQLNAAKAIEYYDQVKTQFSDAAEAVRLFEQKFIRLPEVTIFHPAANGYYESEQWAKALKSDGVAGAPSVAEKYELPYARIDYRNVDEVVLQVYRVDLMKLALAEKNLNNIAGVNLAGVRPLVEKTIKLDAERRFVDQSLAVPLELPADVTGGGRAAEGAYLVICRGADRVASGLVLVTPLALEVTEDADAGRARVSVVNALNRSGARDVHVKVIGSEMNRFRTGETDLRGVYTADGLSGSATAIARDEGGHFAFYRNPTATLLAMAPTKEMQRAIFGSQMRQQQVDYFSNISSDNTLIQTGNAQYLQQLFDQREEGVQVQKAQ
ncbi:MAG: outer membrane protein assembly factor BamD [Phycisphaerales bacterium]|nr:outer membrane protein assembly factor BamD [Phycisphaerales bacterium]MCB9855438.1 outer membrane protein assembly factor BamD [Phycisphaerales bacterium]